MLEIRFYANGTQRNLRAALAEQFILQTLPQALNGGGNTEPVPSAFAYAYGAHSA